ncbi:MAG TPA: ElyC/SanA/YdcF family protein [Verrucomicrobiae bacterium]|nr:ElyC/SanA/YdcF family protein [Verrucomicrobiae bacterium]
MDDRPQPADLIFVLAGRMERKQYGIELWRKGLAPRLLLSVGRFEVSRMGAIDFAKVDELRALRDRTAPGERHFFCEISSSGVRIDRPKLCRWNTYGEVLALRDLIAQHGTRTLLVISTDVHLRRVAVTVGRVLRGLPVEVRYCPVPPGSSSLRKAEWWTRPQDRRYVLKELAKLQAYRAIMSMPVGMITRVMRLR